MEAAAPTLASIKRHSATRTSYVCKNTVPSGKIVKILAALLYIFDYVSSIGVLWQYWKLLKEGTFTPTMRLDCQYYRTTSKVPFYVCLGLMTLDPFVAAVAFWLKLEPGKRPLLSVFFLPVIQLWKACCGSGDDTEPETDALFSATVAMENGPQLILQLSVICFLIWVTGVKAPVFLIISLIFSFLSVAYNAGRAIMYHVTGKWPGICGFIPDFSGIVGGMYTIGAIILRFAAVITIIAAYGESFGGWVYIVTMFVYFVVGIGVFSYVNGLLVRLLKGETTCSWTAQVLILYSAYMCGTIGPLFPVVERTENDNRSRVMLARHLILAIGINMLPDVVVLVVSVAVNSHNLFPACEGVTTPDGGSYMSCPSFIAYFTVGIVLSILPCFVFPRISRP